MDKLQKLIEEVEKLAQTRDWKDDGDYISCGNFDVCKCPKPDVRDHILNTQPAKILPLLRAFQKMQDALAFIEKDCECWPGHECCHCLSESLAKSAIDNL